MISHEFEYDVHIFDTDCYGVAWHGAYTKWLEMGRVDTFKSIGLNLKVFNEEHGIIFPVAEQTIRYKRPAVCDDRLKVKTRVELCGPKIVFYQAVQNVQTQTTVIEARTDVVLMDRKGRMLRRFPEIFLEKIKNNETFDR